MCKFFQKFGKSSPQVSSNGFIFRALDGGRGRIQVTKLPKLKTGAHTTRHGRGEGDLRGGLPGGVRGGGGRRGQLRQLLGAESRSRQAHQGRLRPEGEMDLQESKIGSSVSMTILTQSGLAVYSETSYSGNYWKL